MPGGFDYVLLSVKALPDVYDLASIIESVVTPQHTCILVNTSTSLGTEAYLESRFPTNVVLSLVSGVSLSQLGNSEFEHTGGSDIWVGSAIQNPNIPQLIQYDMAEALSLTLVSGNVDCHVSSNIRQQQWERVLGYVFMDSGSCECQLTAHRPIAFHPLSVLLDCSNLSTLMEKPGCKQLINDLIDELLAVAKAQDCSFPPDFKQKTIQEQLSAPLAINIMHQDFTARRPLEIETFLGSPIKAGKLFNVPTPHLNTLYPVLGHLNHYNQNRPIPQSPPVSVGPHQQRPVQGGPPPNHRPPPGGPNGNGSNGMGPSRRLPPSRSGLDPSAARRPPQTQQRGMAPPNGHPRANGDHSPRPVVSRRNSFDDDLEEFGHIALYGDLVDNDAPAGHQGDSRGRPQIDELALRERELALREREQHLREQELMKASRPNGSRRKTSGRGARSVYGDDEDEGEFYIEGNPPPMPPVDVDNFDMMSVTSRRNRRLTNSRTPGTEVPLQPVRTGRPGIFGRGSKGSRASSSRMLDDVPGMHDPISDNVLMGYSSNRYGTVDRKTLTDNSRANSMSSQRMGLGDIRDDLGGGAYPPMLNGNAGGCFPQMNNNAGGAYPPNTRRMSNAGPGMNGYPPRNGNPEPRGYPSDGRQPVPKHNGQNGFPHQVEQSDGVRQPHVLKGPTDNTVRSTTGSASASTNSGSARGETSAYSSSSSLEKRLPNGVTV